jgi:glycosyltransferase involved in cell wall biosynthesis
MAAHILPANAERMMEARFLAIYELAVTSAGAYSYGDLARIDVPFEPLVIVVVWGSIPALLVMVMGKSKSKQPQRSRIPPQPHDDMTVSVIIPVYNEHATIAEVVRRVQEQSLAKEIIIVDDCSTDGTRELLQETEWPANVHVLYHEQNKGKGAAIRTGVRAVTQDITIIQDADLEYNPSDFAILLRPILDGVADVVYGSRFLGIHRSFMFHHYIGNKFLTLVTNVLYNNILTDMETGYKAFRTPILKDMTIRSNRFDFEPEVTAKVAKQGYRIYEVPIYYAGRDYAEGKKITWRDAFAALWALLRFRFMD